MMNTKRSSRSVDCGIKSGAILPEAFMEISRELFDQQRRPRFGNANPERMHIAYWEWMIRGPDSLPTREQEGVHAELGLIMRGGMLKSVYGPWRARDLFKISLNREDGPIWSFDRMGRTCTKLSDGRRVCVAGEHEDSYDPDFCIYNDVVVFGPTDQIEIYGYPKEIFLPTDFHTATLASDRIILVGSLGYPDDRRPGHTPVYALGLSGYRISEIETSGEMPGWIFKHKADFDSEGIITIRGGEVFEECDGNHRYRRNLEDYALDIRSGVWRQVTNRNWPQFFIYPEDRKRFEMELTPETILPRGVEHTVMPCEDSDGALIVIEGVPVSFTVDSREIQVVVQGDLPSDLSLRIAEEVRSSAEAAVQRRCVLEEI
jgi:hypothetical protein